MSELFYIFAESDGAVILLALFFGTFVSEDLACLSAGSLAATGRIDLAPAILACFLGIFVSDMLLYCVGRAVGPHLHRVGIIGRLVMPGTITAGGNWLRKRGLSAIFVSRFVSGLRLPTYLAAGVLQLDLKIFAAYLALAGIVWTPLLVGAAAIWQAAVPGGVLLGIVVGFVTLRFAFKFTVRKNRRLAWGAVQRVLQWEFWPLWLFYAPVVAYVLVLALRYRSLTLFTAANPGMLAGGFVGESKDEIYRLISSSPAARPYLLRYKKLPANYDPDENYRTAIRFIDDNSLSFPIVIKPDAGERGKGVNVARDDAGLKAAIQTAKGDIIIQEFLDGVEASVFYYRVPHESGGSIFSITEKHFPVVTGDGKSTFEDLILRDERAYIIAKLYFERHAARLQAVPAVGEQFALVDIGSHSKGAIFRDGEHLRSPMLKAKIDEICRAIDGFFFGRFDLRAASFDDLKSGRNFRIIELNGVTSESTNIYDPRYSLIDAFRILFHQWKLAFEIGAANVRNGASVTSVRQLLSLMLGNPSPPTYVRPLHRLSQTSAIPSDRAR